MATACSPLGAVFAQIEVGTLPTVNVTYLVSGGFFSLGGYASILLVVDAARDERDRATEEPMRWWSYQPHRRDWLSAVVLFTGTLPFARSAFWRPSPTRTLTPMRGRTIRSG